MLEKEADELIIRMSGEQFQLDKYLFGPRKKTNFEWLRIFTTLLERILTCLGQDKRVAGMLIRTLILLPSGHKSQMETGQTFFFI